MAKANRQRGEVQIEGPEGEKYKLCLTLGAIAQIEEELGVDSLTEIDSVMHKARMKDVISIFLALLHGGGHEDIERKDMMKWDVSIQELMVCVRDAFAAAGFGDDDDDTEEQKEPSGN